MVFACVLVIVEVAWVRPGVTPPIFIGELSYKEDPCDGLALSQV